MFVNTLRLTSSSDDAESTGLTEAHKTALTMAWTLIKGSLSRHARNIFAKFYEENPEYLRLFDEMGNEALHQHTENVLQSIDFLIVDGLTDPETFDRELIRIVKPHRNVGRSDVSKLIRIIREYFLKQVVKHKTKTLEDALDLFCAKILASFVS